ncbi:hypothetical protein BH10ACI4_BH10ACI4_28770 [soil metagenome]
MAIDPQQQTELTQLYRTYSNEELTTLALTLGDLTDEAQQALKSELASRGLPLATGSAHSPQQPDDSDGPVESTFEFANMEDALLAQSVLESAGISSMVPTSEIGAIDTPRLIVSPSDAQAAERILAHPNALGALSAEDAIFPTAVCPKCGTPDPVLESVEPTNTWRCEACNHTWEDTDLA